MTELRWPNSDFPTQELSENIATALKEDLARNPKSEERGLTFISQRVHAAIATTISKFCRERTRVAMDNLRVYYDPSRKALIPDDFYSAIVMFLAMNGRVDFPLPDQVPLGTHSRYHVDGYGTFEWLGGPEAAIAFRPTKPFEEVSVSLEVGRDGLLNLAKREKDEWEKNFEEEDLRISHSDRTDEEN